MIKLKRNKNKGRLIIGSLLIVFGLLLAFGKSIYNAYLNNKDNAMVNSFFEEKIPTDDLEEDITKTTTHNKSSNYKNPYYAILEIPAISLKKGLVNIDSKNNNVNRNIQTLPTSDTPDIVGGTIILASHSGNSRVSYFKYLYKVNKDDFIYVYYNDIKYVYKVTSIYNQDKTGKISFSKNNNSTLILTTCNQQQKGKQLIVISTLVDKLSY